jgi:hypothetical protein
MLHLDGSPHRWLEAEESKQLLIQVVDDATNRLLNAQPRAGRTLEAVLSALKAVLVRYGSPLTDTDRADCALRRPMRARRSGARDERG